MTQGGPDASSGPDGPVGGPASVRRLPRFARQRFTASLSVVLGIAALILVASVVLTPVPQSAATNPPASCACSRPPTASFPASPINGVVVKVDSTGIGDVRGFTLRVAGGATMDLMLGTLENAAQFAPGHLTEHQATATPVRVYFVVSGGVPVVYRLEDAPALSGSP